MTTIKNLLLLLTILICNIVNGQMINYGNYQLSDIPMYSHNRPVELFIEGEKPTRPYFKAAILENYSQEEAITYADLIKDLQLQAQNIGIDGLIIYKMGSVTKNTTDFDGFLSLMSAKEVIAFGIKYKDNLDYLTDISKEMILYNLNDSTSQLVKVGDFIQGINEQTTLKNGDLTLYETLKPFSLNHLIQEKENWQTATKNNKVFRRMLLNDNGEIRKTVSFTYEKENNISIIYIRELDRIRNNKPKILSKKIELDYNENGTIRVKRNYPDLNNSALYYEETFKYNTNGKVSEKDIYKVDKNKKIQLGKLVYKSYYTLEELKEQFPELRD